MATLTGQSIASSYEQLLHVDADGGGNSTTHVSVKDGDNGTTFALTLATDAVMITSTNRLEFGDDGTYIHQSADGVLDLVSDTEIEINATDVDMNGALDLDGTFTQDAGAVVFNEAGADYDFRVEGVGAANALFVDGANGNVGIGTAAIQSSRSTALEIVGGGSIASPSNADAGITLTNTGGGAGGTATTDLGYIEFYGKDEKRAYIGSRVESDKGVLLFGTDSSTDGSSLTERMRIDPDGNVTIQTGDLIFGTAGKGICLGVTSNTDANTLDDYEEGTWSPVLSDGTNPMTMHGSYDTGYYTKVGNLVTVSGEFLTTSLGSATGAIRITGLPFTVANNAAARAGGVAAAGSGFAITAGHSVTYTGEPNTTYLELKVWDTTAGTSNMQASEWQATGGITIGLSYRAA